MLNYSHGGGFASPIVSQKWRDLSLVEVDAEVVYS